MVTRRAWPWAVAAALALPLVGCDETVVNLIGAADGGADADADADADSDSDGPGDSVMARVFPQADLFEFDAVPVRLTSAFYTAPPPEGDPVMAGDSLDDPPIGPPPDFPPYVFHTAQPAGLEPGQYYLGVVLYVEGGGDVEPVPGVDWVGRTLYPIELGPGTGEVDAHDIPLRPAEGPFDK